MPLADELAKECKSVVGIATTNPVGIDTCLVEGQSYYIGITNTKDILFLRSTNGTW